MGDLGVGRFAKQVAIVLGVAWGVAAYPLHAYGSPRVVWAVAIGCAVCLVNVLAGCTAIAWALRRPRKVFFSTVFGSMGVRMALVGVAVVVLVKATSIHVAGFVAGLFVFFFVFQALEVVFLTRRLPRIEGRG